jgi:hypothetical protein
MEKIYRELSSSANKAKLLPVFIMGKELCPYPAFVVNAIHLVFSAGITRSTSSDLSLAIRYLMFHAYYRLEWFGSSPSPHSHAAKPYRPDNLLKQVFHFKM